MRQPSRGHITLRTGDTPDAKKLHALIQANREEGHLLPRTLDELTVHAGRFVVAVKARRIVGCAELAPLSPHVAEVRSLAVDGAARGSRVGVAMPPGMRKGAALIYASGAAAAAGRPYPRSASKAWSSGTTIAY